MLTPGEAGLLVHKTQVIRAQLLYEDRKVQTICPCLMGIPYTVPPWTHTQRQVWHSVSQMGLC